MSKKVRTTILWTTSSPHIAQIAFVQVARGNTATGGATGRGQFTAIVNDTAKL